MANEIQTKAPWYHEVKWFWSARHLMAGFAGHSERLQIDMDAQFDPDPRHYDLIAAAPEIATERDNLKQELKDLYRAYVGVMETGRDRIISLGGECDSLERMEEGDPALIKARAALRTGG